MVAPISHTQATARTYTQPPPHGEADRPPAEVMHLPWVRWWGRIPAEGPDRDGWATWPSLDLAHPGSVNRAGDALESVGLIEIERTPGGNRRRARLITKGRQYVPVPLIDPRRIDQSAHKLLPTLWAVAETSLAEHHRRTATSPIDAWTADRWATPADVVDLTATSAGNARRQLANLANAGLIERIEGDRHEAPHRYRPCWHLWATRRGASIRASELRQRYEMGPADVLRSMAESEPIAQQITRTSRNSARPTLLTEDIGHISSNPPPKRELVGAHEQGEDSQSRIRPHTTRAIHEQAADLRSSLAEIDGPWFLIFLENIEQRPTDRQNLAEVYAEAAEAGWGIDEMIEALEVNALDQPLPDPKYVKHPTALLAHRLRLIVENDRRPPQIENGRADYEPERYASIPPRFEIDVRNMRQHLPDRNNRDPERDPQYRALIAAGEQSEAVAYAAKRYGIEVAA